MPLSTCLKCGYLTEKGNHAWVSGTLAEAQERTQHIYLFGIVRNGNKTRDYTPDDFHRRQPPTRSDIGHDDLRGDQHDAVSHVEVGGEPVPLVWPLLAK